MHCMGLTPDVKDTRDRTKRRGFFCIMSSIFAWLNGIIVPGFGKMHSTSPAGWKHYNLLKHYDKTIKRDHDCKYQHCKRGLKKNTS